MREHIARLTSDSAVYGLSTIVGRFLNFLLVPFYTNVFPADAYGIVTVVYSFVAFLNVLLACGFDTAFMRFLERSGGEERARVFSAAFWPVAALASACALLVIAFRDPIAAGLHIRPEWKAIVPLTAGILFLDALNVVPFAALRMDRRARRFASIRLTGIVVNIALNLLFILALRMSLVAVFTANLLSSLVTTLLLLPSAARDIRPRIEGTLARAMLAFGLPTVPAGIASMLMQVVDRPLMQRLAGDAAAGIYGANYRLGIFMMLVVTMFQYAWQPFSLQSADLPGARRMFARVLTYFALVGSLVTVSVALFIDDIATVPLIHGRALIGSAYREGLRIVPIILFAYLWTGFTTILNAGILIEKRTGFLAAITAAGAAVNIAANLLLIPRLGYTGGALATLAAYLTTAVLAWLVGRKIFPVPWEYGRVGKILAALGIIAGVWYARIGPPFLPGPAWEVVLLAGFIALLFLFRVFLPSELREMRSLLRRKSL